MKKIIIGIAIFSLIGAAIILNYTYNKADQNTARAKGAIQEFKAVDHTGKTLDLGQHRGKVLVLNFWATYCPPCIDEMPHFIKVQAQFKGKAQFVGISVDDNIDEVNSFLKKHGFKMNYPMVMATEDIFTNFGDMPFLPTTVFVGKDGVVKDQYTGDLSEKKLSETIEKLLNS